MQEQVYPKIPAWKPTKTFVVTAVVVVVAVAAAAVAFLYPRLFTAREQPKPKPLSLEGVVFPVERVSFFQETVAGNVKGYARAYMESPKRDLRVVLTVSLEGIRPFLWDNYLGVLADSCVRFAEDYSPGSGQLECAQEAVFRSYSVTRVVRPSETVVYVSADAANTMWVHETPRETG